MRQKLKEIPSLYLEDQPALSSILRMMKSQELIELKKGISRDYIKTSPKVSASSKNILYSSGVLIPVYASVIIQVGTIFTTHTYTHTIPYFEFNSAASDLGRHHLLCTYDTRHCLLAIHKQCSTETSSDKSRQGDYNTRHNQKIHYRAVYN